MMFDQLDCCMDVCKSENNNPTTLLMEMFLVLHVLTGGKTAVRCGTALITIINHFHAANWEMKVFNELKRFRVFTDY